MQVAVVKSNIIDINGIRSESSGEVGELIRFAGRARFFRSAEGRFHVQVAIGGREEVLRLRSATFRDWLVGLYVKERHKLPSQRNVGRVLQVLEGKARFDADTPGVFVRIGGDTRDGGACGYLDLADLNGRVVKICKEYWYVVERSGVHFKRLQGLVPFGVCRKSSRCGDLDA